MLKEKMKSSVSSNYRITHANKSKIFLQKQSWMQENRSQKFTTMSFWFVALRLSATWPKWSNHDSSLQNSLKVHCRICEHLLAKPYVVHACIPLLSSIVLQDAGSIFLLHCSFFRLIECTQLFRYRDMYSIFWEMLAVSNCTLFGKDPLFQWPPAWYYITIQDNNPILFWTCLNQTTLLVIAIYWYILISNFL